MIKLFQVVMTAVILLRFPFFLSSLCLQKQNALAQSKSDECTYTVLFSLFFSAMRICKYSHSVLLLSCFWTRWIFTCWESDWRTCRSPECIVCEVILIEWGELLWRAIPWDWRLAVVFPSSCCDPIYANLSV